MTIAGKDTLSILIVEDDLIDRKLLTRLLTRSSLGHAQVTSVHCLNSAMEALASESFDVILSDLGLPDCHGIEAASRLQEVAPDIPLIVLSGLDDESTAIHAMQQGVQDYLIKGQVDSQVLVRAIRYAIERKKAEHTLQEAELRYRTIFENSAVGIMMVDDQERLISWNRFTEELLGFSSDALFNRRVQDLYPEEEWHKIRAHKIRQKGMQHHLETRMITQNKTIIDVDVSLSVLKDNEGNVIRTIGVIRDITERKRAEEALQKSDERFRQVVENAEEWIWEVDAEGLYTYVSPVVERIMGYRPEEMVGKMHFFDHFHPTDCDRLKKKAFEVFAREDTFREFENKNLDKHGQVIWLSKSGVPILNECGFLIGYRGVDVDITERRRIHEILHRKQKNLEAIFDAAPVGMLLVDEDLRVRRANDAVRNMASKDYVQIINQLPGYVLGCAHVAENPANCETRCGTGTRCKDCPLFCTIEKSLHTGLPVHGAEITPELYVDGKKIHPVLSISCEPVFIDGAKYAVVSVHDVTDRARAESELRETMEIKSQFISTVSHELRTPLASMKEAVLIVLDGVAGVINDDQSHFLDVAKRNIDRLSRLINDVLNFQKMESGNMKFHLGTNDIAHIAEDACGTMQPFASKRDIHLSLELEPNLPVATLDADRIIQVLTNLISNAIKFTPANGHVRVSVQRVSEMIVLKVSDTGMGIPAQALSKIFDRFYRVHRPGKEIKGTGLGLSIVKSIVKAHNGRISVESVENKGAVFTVELPIQRRSDADILSESEDILLEKTVAP